MGSLGNILGEDWKKAMWLYPKVVGFNPCERWGHSSCFFQGHLYVFGGCCGGMHFSDVLVLNLETMSWSTLVTLGNGPGPRDSHSASLWGNRIIVFGGTNGSKKVNDVHILNLSSKEWIQPMCSGTPPSPRESHTATLVNDEKLVVFGGSGEGVGNYLNDLYILDLRTMSWTSPNVKGEVPPPRDSHTSVAVGNKLFVYGGDCGDRYHGNVDILDIETLTWSRLEVVGSSPGSRAGHTAVRIATKIYVIGGVGDKKYYNDAWVLDTTSNMWSKLEICGQSPQGRFSHTAIVTDSDIAIYGGCGEDERPLGELLILQLGDEPLNGRYNVTMCKTLGNYWNQGRRRSLPRSEDGLKAMLLGSSIRAEGNDAHDVMIRNSKRVKTSVSASAWEMEPEPDEHSLSVSQNSSPSQSDQEQTTVQNMTVSHCNSLPPLDHLNKFQRHPQSNKYIPQQTIPDVCILGETRGKMRHVNLVPSGHTIRSEAELQTKDARSINRSNQNLLGADVQGKVDGAFDSGYLMTANVNGRIFRGVLFAPGPNIMCRGGHRSQGTYGRIPISQPCTSFDRGSSYAKSPSLHPLKVPGLEPNPRLAHQKIEGPPPVSRTLPLREERLRNRSDLQGVVLTLGGPNLG